ncbi:MAG: type II CAAX endopeptidase family protein [Planctomycetota bacterium]|nr:type II CAAX endopeptidase family protein [Planctomycetota bacterium]
MTPDAGKSPDDSGDEPSPSDLYAPPELDTPALEPVNRKLALFALLLLVPAPSLGVFLSMMFEPTQGTLIGKGAYFLSKAWILALPLVWLLWVEKGKISASPPKKGGFGVAIGLGLLIGVVIGLAWWFVGQQYIDTDMLKAAVTANGIGSPLVYLGFTFGYLTFINSLLEEYVWRWFVFRQCERLVGGPAAVVCSALFFTMHHVLALKAQMDWMPTILGSIGVFIGGAVWSWCYLKYRSVWPGYVSHLIVDAAIFGIGWYMIFGSR